MRRDRSAEAFDEFVAARGDALWRSAFLLTGDRHVAEELVQDVLARCWPHWRRVTAGGDFESYVRRVLFTTHTRRWRRRAGHAVASDEVAWSKDRPASADGPDGVEQRRDLAVALRDLSPGQRAVVVLRWFEDLSVDETARVLGVSSGTVKSQTARALAALRRSTHLSEEVR